MNASKLFSAAVTMMTLAACGDEPNDPSDSEISVSVLYITQATQNRDGSVPLVAGRDGLLRVFVGADQADVPAPAIRVRIYHGEVLRDTRVIPAPGSSLPTAVNQGDLNSSWNAKISGALIQPGLRIQAELEHEPAVITTRAMEVVALAPLRIRFVPIRQSENGLTGRVSEANKDQFLALTRKIMPIPGYDADVRAPYTVRFLEIDPQGNSWQTTVSELNAVRIAEGSDRYYYGVVQTPYPGGGVVGIANGIPSRTSLGWDRPQDASETVAHELGHNWGRRHAPCGGAGGVDPQYPYTVAQIGAYGMDVETGELKDPSQHTDIMGYCDANFWISDYTYTGVFNYRATNERASAAVQPSLLVWGRIHDGSLVLEPAFQVNTRPVLPSSPGPYTVQGLDASGSVLFSISFAGDRIPDVRGDQRNFAFAVPLAAGQASRLATLRLTGNERHVERRASTFAAGRERASLQRTGRGQVSLRWKLTDHPMAMVRDPRSGEILAFARGGAVSLQTGAEELEIVLSDGVHNTTTRMGLHH